VHCGAVLAWWKAAMGWQEVREDVGPVVVVGGGAKWQWRWLAEVVVLLF